MHADRPLTAAETRRPEIQLLRAIAVMAVVLFHLWPDRLSGGFVGIDVFFVISGFLITAQLLREVDRTGSIRLREFWARRARRLLPAALLVLAATLVAVLIWVPQSMWSSFVRSIAASALFVENWQLAVAGVDSIGLTSDSTPSQQFWALSIAEQLYIVWPLLLLVAIWVASWTANGAARARRRAIGAVVAIVVAASFVASIVLTATDPAWALLSTPVRAWEFGVGGLLAFLPALRMPGWASVIVSVVGFAGLIASCFALSPQTAFPGYAALIPVIATMLVIVAGTPANVYGKALGFRPLRWLGDMSYSLYLWHWAPLVLLPLILGERLTAALKLDVLVAAVIAAWLTTYLIERPLRTGRVAEARPWRTFAAAVAGIALVATASVSALAIAPASSPRPADDGDDVVEVVAGDLCFGAPALTADRSLCADLPELDGVLRPKPSKLKDDAPVIYTDTCRTRQRDSKLLECVFAPEGESTATVMLVGDSHAAQWFPALERLAERERWELRVLFKSACPFAGGEIEHEDDDVVEACEDWNEAVIDRLAELRPDAVVTSTQTRTQFVGPDGTVSQAAAVTAFAEQWRRVADLGIRVIVIEDTPTVWDEELECAAAPADLMWDCVRPLDKAFARNPGTLADAAAMVEAVAYLDFTDALCTAEGCPTVLGHTIVYRDTSSLISATFMSTLADVVGERLVGAVKGDIVEPVA